MFFLYINKLDIKNKYNKVGIVRRMKHFWFEIKVVITIRIQLGGRVTLKSQIRSNIALSSLQLLLSTIAIIYLKMVIVRHLEVQKSMFTYNIEGQLYSCFILCP